MLRWSLAFFILSILAAVFGFTGLAGNFAGIARVFFIVFAILLILSLFATLFSRTPALSAGARTATLFVVAALVGVGIYAWMDNDMSAERVGRAIDRSVVAARDGSFQTIASLASQAGEATGDAVSGVGERASEAADTFVEERPEDERAREDEAG